MNNLIERLDNCLTEQSADANAGNVFHEFTVSELKSVLARLLSVYEAAPKLLTKFWGHKSDACPLECEQSEDQEILFRRYVHEIIRQEDLQTGF